MIARVIRSGLVESTHEGAVAVALPDGELVASAGDLGRRFFFRSAVKPFQATVSQELGASLGPEQLAVACSSHDGQPVHIAYVEAMLAEAGLVEGDLACPPAWPLAESARAAVIAGGHGSPRRIWHNCSGKHAAMLRACLAQGWPTDGYLAPDHPLQQAILVAMGEAAGEDPGPVGVDGCGAPVFQGTVAGLARAFARLAGYRRYAATFAAMHRFPALTSSARNPDARLATWLDAAAKRGAEGCLGVAVRHRVGLAVKAWDGATRAATAGMLAALDQLGLLVGSTPRYLEDLIRQPVLGGGRPVGVVESTVRLEQ